MAEEKNLNDLARMELVLSEVLTDVRAERDEALRDAQERFREALRESGVSVLDPPSAVRELQHTLRNETDRGCALAGVAYLDYAVTEMLQANMVEDAAICKELFRSTGTLGSFGARIDVAYMLALIGVDAKREMHLLRKIRNDFAHTPKLTSFADSSIASRCAELRFVVVEKQLSPRRRFTHALLGILGLVHGITRGSTHPTSPTQIDFDEIRRSEALKDILRLGKETEESE